MIRVETVYETKGKQFRTLEEAIAHRENLIEEYLRHLPGFQDMPAKLKIGFVQAVLDSRKQLIDLLTYSDKPADYRDDD